jgi:hypothetical protein
MMAAHRVQRHSVVAERAPCTCMCTQRGTHNEVGPQALFVWCSSRLPLLCTSSLFILASFLSRYIYKLTCSPYLYLSDHKIWTTAQPTTSRATTSPVRSHQVVLYHGTPPGPGGREPSGVPHAGRSAPYPPQAPHARLPPELRPPRSPTGGSVRRSVAWPAPAREPRQT